MDMQSIGKMLVLIAAGIALLGIAFWIGGRLGLGMLPGDLRFGGQGWSCFVPITSAIIISIVLTLLLNLALRLFR